MNAGYSGTPLLKKLGVKPDSRIRLIEAPEPFVSWVHSQPEPISFAEDSQLANVIVLFASWQADLAIRLPFAIKGLEMAGGLWIAWPKRASKVPTDITEDRLRDIILPMGLVDNKVCAIDDIWSGLRFVWRIENRR